MDAFFDPAYSLLLLLLRSLWNSEASVAEGLRNYDDCLKFLGLALKGHVKLLYIESDN